jgi:hypothetical protein
MLSKIAKNKDFFHQCGFTRLYLGVCLDEKIIKKNFTLYIKKGKCTKIIYQNQQKVEFFINFKKNMT